MKYRTLAAAATFALLPLAAQAQPVTGVYIGAGIGVNQMLDTHLTNIPNSNLTSNVGVGGVASVGYGFGNGFRGEIEGGYRAQNAKLGGANHYTSSYGPMFNILYDLNLGAGATPYFGAGAGVQWTRLGNSDSASHPVVAAQGIVGVAFPLGTPGLAITAEARALHDFDDAKVSAGHLRNPVNVSGLIGLRYAFGTAAVQTAATTAAVPAPALAQKAEDARTYLLFFDWDRADLTDRSRAIIADAAGASQRLAVTRLEVAGHADRSGTAPFNQALSMRRAQAVAADLVRLGVNKEAISISAFGDTRPLVATAAGVREPQNRRVEIVLK